MGYLSPSSLCPGCQDAFCKDMALSSSNSPLLQQHRVLHTHTAFPCFLFFQDEQKTEQQKLKLSRMGNAWDMGVLVGSVHPEIKVAVAIFWLSTDTAVPGDS